MIRDVVQALEPRAAGRQAYAEFVYLRLSSITHSRDLLCRVDDPSKNNEVEEAHGLRTGDIVWAREAHINEIPLGGWQPDDYMAAVKHL